MSGLHVRLREERLRLGLPQYSLAAVGGVKPNAQVKYENGRRLPRGDYLAAIAVTGVDLLFILTGTRSAGMSRLTGDERGFIAAFRTMEGDDKKLMSHLVFRLDTHSIHATQPMNVSRHDGVDGVDGVEMLNG
ncbi:MAG TPA: helix-turn-helix transcriptional regulator [Pseudomonas sp.]|jgi:transcriptional regulator with XRE-family HTH domain